MSEPGAGWAGASLTPSHISKIKVGCPVDAESALDVCGGRRAPYLDSRAGWVPQAAKNVFKKACVDGLISGFGGQACSCHSDAAGCGQKGEGQAGSRCRKREDMSCWVFWRGEAQSSPGSGASVGVLGEFWPSRACLSFSLPKCNSTFFLLTLKVIKVLC